MCTRFLYVWAARWMGTIASPVEHTEQQYPVRSQQCEQCEQRAVDLGDGHGHVLHPTADRTLTSAAFPTAALATRPRRRLRCQRRRRRPRRHLPHPHHRLTAAALAATSLTPTTVAAAALAAASIAPVATALSARRHRRRPLRLRPLLRPRIRRHRRPRLVSTTSVTASAGRVPWTRPA